MFTKQDLERIFEKQIRYEQEQAESVEKIINDRHRSMFLERKSLRLLSDCAMDAQKQWKESRKSSLAGANVEARSIQKDFRIDPTREYHEILKQGILTKAIQIHETPTGFEIDTPQDQVDKFVIDYLGVTENYSPSSDDLTEGKFLMETIPDSRRKERINLIRHNLIKEYHAETPSEFMLVDIAISSYERAMFATKLEMQVLHQATDYPVEMFEVMAKGIQPFVHTCQNQLLRTLNLLREHAPGGCRTNVTIRHLSKTEVNIRLWGNSLKLALREITQTKERSIHLNEIKQTMIKYGIDIRSISNADVAYALHCFGFTERTHTCDGNRYNISREQVHALMKT